MGKLNWKVWVRIKTEQQQYLWSGCSPMPSFISKFFISIYWNSSIYLVIKFLLDKVMFKVKPNMETVQWSYPKLYCKHFSGRSIQGLHFWPKEVSNQKKSITCKRNRIIVDVIYHCMLAPCHAVMSFLGENKWEFVVYPCLVLSMLP